MMLRGRACAPFAIAASTANLTCYGSKSSQRSHLTSPASVAHNRVGGGIAPAVLPHHRTDRSVSGGSCRLCRTNIGDSELGFVRCVAWRCYGHRDLLRDFRPLSPSLASVSPRNFCPIRSESTRDYPLMTGSVLHRSGFSGYYDLCCNLPAHPDTLRCQ
jgi:hypothetical protein